MINQNEVSKVENNDDGQYSCEFLHPNIIQESVGINQDACLKGLSDLGRRNYFFFCFRSSFTLMSATRFTASLKARS